jgi:PAS domain S-box-containing protein
MSETLRLFVIEDDDHIALLIRKQLERAGHKVATCRTAADALIVLGHETFDLVLLDQVLPDMTGLELLKALAREGITVPVLLVTGHGSTELAAEALRAGALDYVAKDGGLGFLSDLPRRVKEAVARNRLQDLNRLLSQALDSAHDGVMITDLQGAIVHVNGALERLSGYSRQELLGQTPRLLKSGLHAPEVYARLWQTVLGRKGWHGELTNRRKDGSLCDVSLTVAPVVDGRGRLTHFIGICRDVSERKQLERQLLQAQKMQSVGTLAGGVAHEFNNLLAGIHGYASLGLRQPGLAAPLREFLGNIVNLADRAAGLTRQLLAFARRPALSRQPTALADLVRATAELVRRTMHQEVALDVPPAAGGGEALTALADPNQLQQVLVNLALNARDALTEPGPITFRLRRRVLSGERAGFPDAVPAGDYVVLEVMDTGRGMTPNVLSQALDPFFTTKEVGQGTGLGLPMVYGIVKGHQGFLTIASEPGRGTCMAIYLPRLPAAAGPRAGAARGGPQAGPVMEPERAPGRTILVVDDEEAVLDVMRRFLEMAGHQVHGALSGAEALAHLGKGPAVDLVILDLLMPGEEEAATFHRLRQRLPQVPVLLCTGLLQLSQSPDLLRAGAAGILRKPFRMSELWDAVNQALAQRVPPVD